MRQLRLVGIHENGESLHLSSEDGNSFALPIDEALRSALTRAARADRTETPVSPLSPREIQTRIRSGATAEDVANASGMSLEHIMRYEGPVLAEREYIATQARNIEVSAPQTHDGYRSIFGEEPANLGEMVAYRAHSMGIDGDTIEWDAWRSADGSWDVVATFDVPGNGSMLNVESISEETVARWIFHPARKSLQNANRWAQVLSELEHFEAPVGTRRLSAVADHPFDIDANADGSEPVDFETAVADSEELLDVLSARRGQRLGVDEEGDDNLAAMLNRIPASQRPGTLHPDDDPRLAGPVNPETGGLPKLYDGISTRTTQISVVPALRPVAESATDDDSDTEGSSDDAAAKKKAKRSSVPSWDDIVFGRRNND